MVSVLCSGLTLLLARFQALKVNYLKYLKSSVRVDAITGRWKVKKLVESPSFPRDPHVRQGSVRLLIERGHFTQNVYSGVENERKKLSPLGKH